MIFGIDGISATGKSTLIQKYCEKYPDSIKFKGAGAVNVGMQQSWQDYNFWMRNVIENLDKINDYKKVILWDRFLTDAVYSTDMQYSSEILRVMKSHKNKAIIYIKPEANILKKRNSKEGEDYKEHISKYEDVIKSFKTLNITLKKDEDYLISDRIIDEVHTFIRNQINEVW